MLPSLHLYFNASPSGSDDCAALIATFNGALPAETSAANTACGARLPRRYTMRAMRLSVFSHHLSPYSMMYNAPSGPSFISTGRRKFQSGKNGVTAGPSVPSLVVWIQLRIHS